jgi:hypothetical protein
VAKGEVCKTFIRRFESDPRLSTVDDADDLRVPLRIKEGVGGDKKYEQILGRVVVLRNLLGDTAQPPSNY